MALVEWTPNQSFVFGLVMGVFLGAFLACLFWIRHFNKFTADLPTKDQVKVLEGLVAAADDNAKEIQKRWDRYRGTGGARGD